MKFELPEPLRIETFYQRTRSGVKFRRYVRSLGRRRSFDIAVKVCRTFQPGPAKGPWVWKAVRALDNPPAWSGLVQDYDRNAVRSLCYQTRSFLNAVDLVCCLRTEQPFERVYLGVLWSMMLSYCHPAGLFWRRKEGKFFRTLSSMHFIADDGAEA